MKIGEFAKAVGTCISVLRHYDREGLLFCQYFINRHFV
ncbi:MAG: MerR family DNA-binding transcriptional regulator [Oscillospiraceae bacterium]|nr:MerR family DNA-binding transcriptional regulator [Oscillospiraceae bacterium]